MTFDFHQLPAVNAGLNATATVLLIAGYRLIKQGLERAHKWTMLIAFAVSIAFLASYLTYHALLANETGAGHTTFQGPPLVKYLYLAILLTHVVLAAIVPVLALLTIYSGLKDRRERHRRLARWTFPIWLYVSVTGVVIYVMLYHLYPAEPPSSIIETAESSCLALTGSTT